ncbi:MAG: RNA polymerase sigma factor [Clostridiales bacterium]|nr:RNA polymerase sigma factor [Clostridiales bacterium]
MSRYAKEVNKYLVAIKKGDKTKYQPLFDLTANHLLGVAAYYLKDRSYCEDVVSIVFEKIFKYIDTYQEGHDAFNWICKIAENTARDINDTYKVEVALDNQIASYNRETDEAVYDENLDITSAIDKLDSIDREIVYGYYFFDKTYQKIAEELNLAKSTVKKRMDKILIKLKDFLK